jgi:hypothetical protein
VLLFERFSLLVVNVPGCTCLDDIAAGGLLVQHLSGARPPANLISLAQVPKNSEAKVCALLAQTLASFVSSGG